MKNFVLLLLCFIHFCVVAQKPSHHIYKYEIAYGLNFNTIAGGYAFGGLYLRYSKFVSEKMSNHFSFEATNIRHPKEVRITSAVTGSPFISGKQNYLYALRFHYGRQILLLQKGDRQGVQVSWTNALGASLGFAAPYMILYDYGNGVELAEQYKPEIHTNISQITGTGTFGESLSGASFNPGLSAKTSLLFEFGTIKSRLLGCEAGFMIDAYSKKTILVPLTSNRKIYTSAFVNVFLGARR